MGLSSSTVRVGVDQALQKMNFCCSDGAVMSEWFERRDHPLLNHVILSKVIRHLKKKELKECRLVCKAWNVSTIPFTRKEFGVTLFESSSCHFSFANRTPTFENFIECFSSNKLGFPFGRFALRSFCLNGGSGVGPRFLQMCGPTTLSLDLLDNYYFTVEDVSQLLRSTPVLEKFRLPRHLRSRSGNIVKLFPEDSNPRLSSLKTLIVEYDCPAERDKFCPTFLEELIAAAENISCLELHEPHSVKSDSTGMWEYDCYYGTSSSLQVLRLIEKLGRESSIQELTIFSMDREEFELIELLLKMSKKQNGLKLKLFRYDRCHESELTLIPLISHFNNTLENLTIEACFSSNVELELQKMLRLRRLSIYLFHELNMCMSFSQTYPVLEELIIYEAKSGPCQECDEFSPESDPCPNMKSLDISSRPYRIIGFNRILKTFPNLTQLQMTIKSDGVEILRQIWSQLTLLKYLNIDGTVETNDSLDSVLTGISTLGIQQIRDALNNINKRKTAVERRDTILKLREQHCRFPSIADLKDLRRLDLSLRGNLTDLTGYLGFYSMKRLKHLTVDSSISSELTKTCCEILINDMELVSWTIKLHLHKSHYILSSDGNYYWSCHKRWLCYWLFQRIKYGY